MFTAARLKNYFESGALLNPRIERSSLVLDVWTHQLGWTSEFRSEDIRLARIVNENKGQELAALSLYTRIFLISLP